MREREKKIERESERERKRERERERENKRVCVRERERKRERRNGRIYSSIQTHLFSTTLHFLNLSYSTRIYNILFHILFYSSLF